MRVKGRVDQADVSKVSNGFNYFSVIANIVMGNFVGLERHKVALDVSPVLEGFRFAAFLKYNDKKVVVVEVFPFLKFIAVLQEIFFSNIFFGGGLF